MICFDSELFPQNFVRQLNNDQKASIYTMNALNKLSELWHTSAVHVNRKARPVVEGKHDKSRNDYGENYRKTHTERKNLNLYKLNEWLMINNSTVKSEVNGFSPNFSNLKNITESWDSKSANVQVFEGIHLLSYESSSLPPLLINATDIN